MSIPSVKIWKNELFVSFTLLSTLVGATYVFGERMAAIKQEVRQATMSVQNMVSRSEVDSWIYAMRAANPMISFPDFPNY
jgi:hypothetical protein